MISFRGQALPSVSTVADHLELSWPKWRSRQWLHLVLPGTPTRPYPRSHLHLVALHLLPHANWALYLRTGTAIAGNYVFGPVSDQILCPPVSPDFPLMTYSSLHSCIHLKIFAALLDVVRPARCTMSPSTGPMTRGLLFIFLGLWSHWKNRKHKSWGGPVQKPLEVAAQCPEPHRRTVIVGRTGSTDQLR